MTVYFVIIIQPWKGYEVEKYAASDKSIRYRPIAGSETPQWWRDYNKVKHNRVGLSTDESEAANYRRANLGNVINAAAGLYTLEMTFMGAIGTRDDLEAFANRSVLFGKDQFSTSRDIDELFGDLGN